MRCTVVLQCLLSVVLVKILLVDLLLVTFFGTRTIRIVVLCRTIALWTLSHFVRIFVCDRLRDRLTTLMKILVRRVGVSIVIEILVFTVVKLLFDRFFSVTCDKRVAILSYSSLFILFSFSDQEIYCVK